MENNFNYNYSAKQSDQVQAIRARYMEHEVSKLELLKKLDAQVKRPANVFGYIFGSIAAIIMGCGMSLVMTDLPQMLDIANPMTVGIAIGVVGLVLSLINYPVYKKMLASRREKFAPQILALSDEIMKGE